MIFPILSINPLIGFLFTSVVLWFFTFINILGVKTAGMIQSVSTAIKLTLFGAFIILAGLHFNNSNIYPLFPQGKGLNTIPMAATPQDKLSNSSAPIVEIFSNILGKCMVFY